MKIHTLHTIHAVVSKNYSSTFTHTQHNLVFSQELGGFIIDGVVFIPRHSVREVIIEPEVEVGTDVQVTTLEHKPRAKRTA